MGRKNHPRIDHLSPSRLFSYPADHKVHLHRFRAGTPAFQALAQVSDAAKAAELLLLFNYNAGVGVTRRNASGTLTVVNIPNFPALFANGMAMAVGQMAPCGMNTPYTRPRAIEFLGARFAVNTLTQGQGTIFLKGSIHYQINTGCEPRTFVAALNGEDPGTVQVAQRCRF
ncbi:hypothetical protein BDM02DRAFT_3188242 [Thelephora ganbajun]|uniref:Uncharacterized protein n=1 Tax=Thelephora ganbajun TaxID=370292 RepID=A0ACB6ZC35_THEGA|nr:hypothetical protein BDM02DRAFT_3188242 [Thelephora ganbajun]